MMLDGANCTLVPPVAQRGVTADVDAVGGFPVRVEPLPGLPGVVLRTAQGLVGGDFDCASSPSPGTCTWASPMLAAAACSNTEAGRCQAVVVYASAAGGCADGNQLAVLKSSNLAPSNAFMSPYVYTLERVEGEQVSRTGAGAGCLGRAGTTCGLPGACACLPPGRLTLARRGHLLASPLQTGGFLLRSETSLIEGPQPSGAASGPAAAAAPGLPPLALADNSTDWLGCMVSTIPALVDGTIVETLSGLASTEACCRACRADIRCNVWTYCPGPEGCR